jgi:hypothetical protein
LFRWVVLYLQKKIKRNTQATFYGRPLLCANPPYKENRIEDHGYPPNHPGSNHSIQPTSSSAQEKKELQRGQSEDQVGRQ